MNQKRTYKWIAGSILAATLFGLIFAAAPVSAQGNERRGGRGSSRGSIQVTPLSAEEEAALQEAILEEYGALNTYQAVIDQFGSTIPFSRVVNAEQQHVNVLVRLAERYGVDVPVNPGLTEPLAIDTVAEACAIGVSAEIVDADLYTELMKDVTHQDIWQVFTNLQSASLNQHLPAFEQCD
jgi:hypothetical protein